MFTVLFSDTSYNRLGVRLFLYPPHGERLKRDSGDLTPEEREYRLKMEPIVDLDLAIDKAISWTELLKNLEEANAHALSEWKELLNEVNKEADNLNKLLEDLENLELPNDLMTRAEDLSEKARRLARILPNNLPENVQATLNSRTDLRILPSLIKKLPGKLGKVRGLLSRKLRKKK